MVNNCAKDKYYICVITQKEVKKIIKEKRCWTEAGHVNVWRWNGLVTFQEVVGIALGCKIGWRSHWTLSLEHSMNYFCFVMLCVYGHTCGIRTFPGQGSTQSCTQTWQHRIQATCAHYTAACSNPGSSSPWRKLGSEPASSQRQLCVLNTLSHSGRSAEHEFGIYLFSNGLHWVDCVGFS